MGEDETKHSCFHPHKTRHLTSLMFDGFQKHRPRPNAPAAFAVEGLINDQFLARLGMLGDAEDLVESALEMPVFSWGRISHWASVRQRQPGVSAPGSTSAEAH